MNFQAAGKTFILAITFILAAGFVTDTSAFDGKRKGLFFKFGLGPGHISYTQENIYPQKDNVDFDESRISVFSNLGFGYAPSEKLMLYWMSKTSWFKFIDRDIDDKSQSYAISVGGLGIQYYLSDQAPSLYVNAGGGLALRSRPFKGDDSWPGFGVAGGIGYELSRYWNVELDVLYVMTKKTYEEEDTEFTGDGMSAGVTLNIMLY